MDRTDQQTAKLILRMSVLTLLWLGLIHSGARARCLTFALTAKQSSPITIPFDGTNNLIVVNATINGQGPFRLVLDTGSSEYFLSRELSDTLGLKAEGSAVVDVGGKQTTRAALTEVSELKIGDVLLRNLRFFTAPLPKSYPFQGILGAEFFKQFVVTIDSAHSFIQIALPGEFVYPETPSRIPIRLRDGLIPEAKAEVDSYSGWFKIDTGYNGSLALFAEFIAQHKSLAKNDSGPQNYDPGGQTMAGEVGKTRIVQIKVLKLETTKGRGLIQRNVAAALFEEKGGSNSAYAGAIGTLVLDAFRVTFDYRHRLMILEANRD